MRRRDEQPTCATEWVENSGGTPHLRHIGHDEGELVVHGCWSQHCSLRQLVLVKISTMGARTLLVRASGSSHLPTKVHTAQNRLALAVMETVLLNEPQCRIWILKISALVTLKQGFRSLHQLQLLLTLKCRAERLWSDPKTQGWLGELPTPLSRRPCLNVYESVLHRRTRAPELDDGLHQHRPFANGSCDLFAWQPHDRQRRITESRPYDVGPVNVQKRPRHPVHRGQSLEFLESHIVVVDVPDEENQKLTQSDAIC
mmetsp:Transcript_29773/g.79126  ORF Transcript_29773/g.79126 Transcript_29773/m.79126 type:complete len:257 (-) Transcript_29773:70-840(-)